MNNFAIFILSHGRPDNIKTLNTLKKCNYTGKWYIVCDNEDNQLEKYIKKYKDKVLVFDKLKKSKEFDTMDTFKDRRTVVYARNACLDFARELGLKYYLELDDDYSEFAFRYKEGRKMKSKLCTNLDKLIEITIKFLNDTNALTVAYAQGGDFIGGTENGNLEKGLGRKCMNTFFCKTENNLQFVGRVNEDVNTYTQLGMKGELLFTIYKVAIGQSETQKSKGGMTEQYLDAGTYVKSFYSIIGVPSAVKIAIMNSKHPRIHHKVLWNNCVPKIISENYKK